MSEQSDLTNAILRERGVIPAGNPEAGIPVSAEGAPPELPAIRLPGRNVTIAQFSRELGSVLSRNGVFLRGDLPVCLDKKHRRLMRLDADALRSYGDDQALIHRLEKSGEEFIKVRESMKKDIAGAVLSSKVFLEQQRDVWRVNAIPLPILRADGRLELLSPGFDHESQILTMPSEFTYRVMPIAEAVTFLKNVTAGFPMPDRDPESGLSPALAVHMAAWLTPFVLAMLPRQALLPMFIYASNRPGSGKSLLVKMILYTMFGTAAAIPFGRDEEELRKLFDTEALANSPYIFFDNVKRSISSMLIDMWITQASWKGRKMSTQMNFEGPKQGIIYISSNHAQTDKDSNRRSLICEMFMEDAEINERKFDRILDDATLVRDDIRCDMLSALWSLVVHWDQSGRPKGPTSLSSFELWASLIGGIVHCAGFGDPLARSAAVTSGDPESKDMKQLVTVLAGELIKKLEEDADEDEEAPAADLEGWNQPKAAPVAEEEAARVADFTFEKVIEICQANDLFVTRIDGKEKEGVFELTRSSRIGMGKLLGREAGQSWMIDGIGRVRFGRRGSKNWRSFRVELVD